MGQETGDKYGTALSLASLGVVAWYQQDYESATSLLQQSLGLHHELGDNAGILNCAETLAKTAAQGKGDRAALLWGASAALREVAGAPLPPSDRVDYERVVATTRASVDTETFDSAWEEGRVLTLDQIMSVAFDPHRN